MREYHTYDTYDPDTCDTVFYPLFLLAFSFSFLLLCTIVYDTATPRHHVTHHIHSGFTPTPILIESLNEVIFHRKPNLRRRQMQGADLEPKKAKQRKKEIMNGRQEKYPEK